MSDKATIKPMIINNTFVLRASFSSGSVSHHAYERSFITLLLCEWQSAHRIYKDPAGIPTKAEVDETVHLFNAALPCLRNVVPLYIQHEIWKLDITPATC